MRGGAEITLLEERADREAKGRSAEGRAQEEKGSETLQGPALCCRYELPASPLTAIGEGESRGSGARRDEVTLAVKVPSAQDGIYAALDLSRACLDAVLNHRNREEMVVMRVRVGVLGLVSCLVG